MSSEGGLGSMLKDLGHSLGGLFGGGHLEPEQQTTLEVLFGLLGYLAKLDSLITSHEADFINGLMDQLKLNIREREVASAALELGRTRGIDLTQSYARFRSIHKPGGEQCNQLFDALIRLAAADERLRPKERAFLEQAAVELGFDVDELDRRLALSKVGG
ncbi:TerB family tellurite resistance protein [Pseudomarimonas salicorniae]|uniref:TerB family tellurite resistance protein n=1 Tax=Pseudomarimonas salicorniae TaxID=2933270 RepID=A0ABT0GN16_9GAMM|nr:TerB family tellurite resistance protein [Lysobacter sp. CAU 1642]MCK7595392.1 TerB family tellurite resistance protein [Lysobacter sp. CAU 1642]